MPTESANLLSGCEIPQFDGFVSTTTSKGFAIWANGDGINPIRMPTESADLLFGCEIPQFDGVVTTTTDKGFAIWAKDDGKNPVRMPSVRVAFRRKGADLLSRALLLAQIVLWLCLVLLFLVLAVQIA